WFPGARRRLPHRAPPSARRDAWGSRSSPRTGAHAWTMGAAPERTDLARQRADRALQGGSRRVDPSRSRGVERPGGMALLALQRRAGNAAVSALLAGKDKVQGPAAERIAAGLAQLRSDEPALDVVEAA